MQRKKHIFLHMVICCGFMSLYLLLTACYGDTPEVSSYTEEYPQDDPKKPLSTLNKENSDPSETFWIMIDNSQWCNYFEYDLAPIPMPVIGQSFVIPSRYQGEIVHFEPYTVAPSGLRALRMMANSLNPTKAYLPMCHYRVFLADEQGTKIGPDRYTTLFYSLDNSLDPLEPIWVPYNQGKIEQSLAIYRSSYRNQPHNLDGAMILDHSSVPEDLLKVLVQRFDLATKSTKRPVNGLSQYELNDIFRFYETEMILRRGGVKLSSNGLNTPISLTLLARQKYIVEQSNTGTHSVAHQKCLVLKHLHNAGANGTTIYRQKSGKIARSR